MKQQNSRTAEQQNSRTAEQQNSRTFSVTVSARTAAELQQIAENQRPRTSRSALVQYILEEWLATQTLAETGNGN